MDPRIERNSIMQHRFMSAQIFEGAVHLSHFAQHSSE
jgi:hypothetical protein